MDGQRLTRSYFPLCVKLSFQPMTMSACVGLVGRALIQSHKHLPSLKVRPHVAGVRDVPPI